jgi:hypothetical protein
MWPKTRGWMLDAGFSMHDESQDAFAVNAKKNARVRSHGKKFGIGHGIW